MQQPSLKWMNLKPLWVKHHSGHLCLICASLWNHALVCIFTGMNRKSWLTPSAPKHANDLWCCNLDISLFVIDPSAPWQQQQTEPELWVSLKGNLTKRWPLCSDMNQLSKFYCFIILGCVNTTQPDHLQTHTHTHTNQETHSHTGTYKHRHAKTLASIFNCLKDKCLFIKRHQSILFGDWRNVVSCCVATKWLEKWG